MNANLKKIISLFCAVALFCSLGLTAFAAEESAKTPISITSLDPASRVVEFSGVADGDDVSVDFDKIEMELYGSEISTEVTEANVCEYPYDADAEKVYDDYGVNYNKEENVIYIEMKNLKPHKNANGEVAFWTGFAVKAPEGAKKFTYSLSNGGSTYELLDVETIDEAGTEGVAFYFDANAENRISYVSLQWFDVEGNPVFDYEFANIDFSAVECYELKGDVVKANVRDYYEDGAVCKNYSVGEKNGVVTIKADDLKMHTSDGQGEGYWTGFAVTAPTDADKFDYVIEGLYLSSGNNVALETIDEEGTKGVAFYLDAEYAEYDYRNDKRFFNVSLQWRDADGNVISARTDYHVDVTDVELYELEGDVVKANVRDYHGDYDVYTDYKVSEKNGIVTISMDDLLMHKSSDENFNEPAFWTGFAVTAPLAENADIARFNFSINGHGADGISLETIDEEGTKGVAFYLDMRDAYYNDKTEKEYFNVSLQWCDADGNPLSAWKNYYVDVTDVNCKYFDGSKIAAAKLEDHSDAPETELYEAGTYKADYEYDEDWNEYYVMLSAKELKKHTNANDEEGYWVGFSLVAPEGATKFDYSFGGSWSYGPVPVEWLDAGATDAPEDDVYGAAFYVDASDYNAPTYAEIMWYREDGTPYDGFYNYYLIDTTNVELAIEDEFDVDATIAAAPISDNDETPKAELYTEGSYSATLAADGKTIEIAADKLHAHKNRDGAGVRGAWVGVEFTDAPEGAEFAKFAFTPGYWWGNYRNVIDLAEEDVRFYVNVFDPDAKDAVWIQYFDAAGKALTNIKRYTIDTSDVTLYYGTENGKPASIKIGEDVAPAAHWEYDSGVGDFVVSDRTVSYGNSTVTEKKGKITLGADCLFIHTNQVGSTGAWIGFSTTVEDAAYIRYAFCNSDDYYYNITWDEAGKDGCENEIEGTEYFYVDASDYDYKDNLKVQFFNAEGEALTGIVEYDIDVTAVDYSGVEYFDVLSSGIALTGADAEKYELVYEGMENIADNQFVDVKSSLKYVYADVEIYGNGSVTNKDKVWVRDTDYSDGIKTNKLTAKADSGYEFTGWYNDIESDKATITIDQDKSYKLYAVFTEKSTSSNPSRPSGNGGGGLVASGTVTTDKEEDKADDTTEDKVEQPATDTELAFTDVDANAWYYEDVKAAVENGLMNGISASTFAPNASLTRAMFVTILYRVAGEPAVEKMSDFTDVPANEYYANAVAWASANGIVNGVSADKFAPNAEITREQMATIIYRYGKATGIVPASENDISYTDADEISDYAKDAAKWAYNAGIILGNADGSFAPSRTATRAEAATIFVRLLSLINID